MLKIIKNKITSILYNSHTYFSAATYSLFCLWQVKEAEFGINWDLMIFVLSNTELLKS